jgi:hypothetical protein
MPTVGPLEILIILLIVGIFVAPIVLVLAMVRRHR